MLNMKKFSCEMCGSTDLIKQDGVFVCQSCGMKYSAEEAKKMMIEGTVDVSGSTIKVDKTKAIENNLSNAHQSLIVKDWSGARSFYSLVRQDDPDNIEALIYDNYCRAMESLRVNKIYERQSIFEAFKNSILLFCVGYVADEKHEKLLQKLNKDILELVGSSFVYTSHTTNGLETDNDSNQTTELFCTILTAQAITTVSKIAPKYEGTNPKMVCYIHESSIILLETVLKLGCVGRDVQKIQSHIMESHRKAAAIDPSHVIPETPPKVESSGGCYVATAVYGSYDCPQVWTLRRYRDYTLAETWYGRLFIKTYYAISPTLVKWFGHTNWFKKICKNKLDRMVANLQKAGIESTPYVDKNW